MSERETWTRVTPRLACSNVGYCVEILGMAGVAYIEGETRIDLPSEPTADGGFALHRSLIRASPDRVAEIVHRVQGGLDAMGSPLYLDPP